MEWTIPRFARADVDRAGETLRSRRAPIDDMVRAVEVLDNWRASHAFPLNSFQMVLRDRAKEIDQHALIAQRLKRIPSIVAKLSKQDSMRLSQMQDIGGCRAVLRSVTAARRVRDLYLRRRSSAVLVGAKDYVATPAASGYRSFHLVYRYQSGRSAARAAYNGQLVEIQVRSKLQHAWATAVETVGLVTFQALKSSEGTPEWLDLFRHISCLFAASEGTAPVPGLPELPEVVRIVRERSRDLRIAQRLRAVRTALKVLEDRAVPSSTYYMLILDPAAESLEIRSYLYDQLELATAEYTSVEQEISSGKPRDAVLVRAESMSALRKAYPNYFLDTSYFLQRLNELSRGPSRSGG
jgi:hypothetical protein